MWIKQIHNPSNKGIACVCFIRILVVDPAYNISAIVSDTDLIPNKWKAIILNKIISDE